VGLLRFITAALGLFGRGRSPAMLFNLMVPRRGYRAVRDIAYREGSRAGFDLYLPLTVEADVPTVLFFYGGGFRAGRKSEYRVVGEALATLGIIVAVADYPIDPEARFPNFLEDAARAVAKLHAVLPDHGGDPTRLFLAGHSAGAYISVMLAADERWLASVGAPRAWIRGVIGIAGMYGARPGRDSVSRAIFGPEREEIQPIAFIRGDAPPMLIVVGAEDGAEQVASARALAARIREAGGRVEEIVYPRVGHSGIILSLARPFRRRAPLRTDIVRFVRAR
jgi:acetyl esterase/lipase